MKPFHTQETDTYKQFWFNINVNEYMLYPENESPSKTTERVFGITIPKKIKRNYKYPFLLNLDFNIAGKSQGWYAKKKVKDKSQSSEYTGFGGLIEKNDNTDYLYEGANITGFRYLQNFYNEIIDKDIIIIHTSMVGPDSYYYAECKNETDEYIKNYENLCWYSDNPDLDYLKNLFDIMYNSKLYDELGIDINYDKMALFGYSVGAQAVSRYINEFPFLRTYKSYKFPDIKSAILLAGGSYQCYNYALYDDEKLFKNCTSDKKKNNGCCPENFTEENYMDSVLSWKNHPPVMCIQQLNDFFADPNASIYYINELKKHNVPCTRLTSYGYQHGFANNDQVKEAELFTSDYLTDKNFFAQTNNSSSNKKSENSSGKIILIIFIIILIAVTTYISYTIRSKESYVVLTSLLVLFITTLIKNSKKIENFDEPVVLPSIEEQEEMTNYISFKKNNKNKKENFGKYNIEKKENFENSKKSKKKEESCKILEPPREYKREEIIERYNNNGLLVTMNSTKLYCPQFVEQLLKYDESGKLISNCPLGQKDINCSCVKPEECDIFDVGDLKKLLRYNYKDAGTLCYALDTTLIQYNLMPLVFGPYLHYDGTGESFQIGILLDYDIIKDYIACAYSFDGGSIGRTPPNGEKYGIFDKETEKTCKLEASKITDKDIQDGKLHTGEKTLSKNSCPATVMAGCVNFPKTGEKNGTYKPQIKEFDVRDPNQYEINKCIDRPDEWCFTPNAFADSLTNPFYEGSKEGMELFKKQTQKVQNIIGRQARPIETELNIYTEKTKKDYNKKNPNQISGDYFAYQIPENINYPQNKNKNKNTKLGWGNNGYRENEIDLFIPQKENTEVDSGNCEPTDQIKKIWERAIIGIFTNNVCFSDVKYNNIENNYPGITNNCCNPKFNEDLVLKLVEKFNKSPNRNKINGYIINTFRPDQRIESGVNEYPLEIRQIER